MMPTTYIDVGSRIIQGKEIDSPRHLYAPGAVQHHRHKKIIVNAQNQLKTYLFNLISVAGNNRLNKPTTSD